MVQQAGLCIIQNGSNPQQHDVGAGNDGGPPDFFLGGGLGFFCDAGGFGPLG